MQKTKNYFPSDKFLCVCSLTLVHQQEKKMIGRMNNQRWANNANCAQMLTFLLHWAEYQTNFPVW